MQVKEVEELLGITRANIRFYEKEGLLNPKRSENGYRSYTQEDVQCLKKIILFRKLGFSIPDIRQILHNEVKPSVAVRENIAHLESQMQELNGALMLCRTMEQDEKIDDEFDLERYWGLMEEREEQGGQFSQYLKDYAEFERNRFFGMWRTVFFADLEKLGITDKGLKVFAIAMLGICCIRGLAWKYLWHYGSFLSGFLYPFVLFGIITVLTLPLFLLNKWYADRELSGKEQGKKISIHKMLPFLLLYFVLMLIGMPLFVERVIYDTVYQGKNYIITGNPYILYVMAGMYLFAVFPWLYGEEGVFDGMRAQIPAEIRKKVLVFAAGMYLLCLIIYGAWFYCVTEEGIEVRRFFWSKEYVWEDTAFCQLKAGGDGTLRYIVVMRDGRQFKLLGGTSSSQLDEVRYPEGEEDFLIELSAKLSAQDVPLLVEDWDGLYEKLTDYWDEAAVRIREAAGE